VGYNSPMAKAKKPSAASETPAAENAKKPAAKKPAAKKAAASKAQPMGSSMIDTGLAAQTAARLIAAKKSGSSPSSTEGKKETSTFKQLRESMTKGHSSSVNSILNSSMPPDAKKSNLPFQGGKQVGHNQTFGSDASKNFVPRRTSG